MPMIVVPANVPPRQVDDFPAGCARSQKGAIYVRPASTLDLTDDEWTHLLLRHRDLADRMIVVASKPTLKTRLEPRLAKEPELKKKLEEAEGKVSPVPKEKALSAPSTAGNKKKTSDKG